MLIYIARIGKLYLNYNYNGKFTKVVEKDHTDLGGGYLRFMENKIKKKTFN